MIPTPDILHRASEILRELESLQAELTSLFNGGRATAPAKRRGRPRGSGKAASLRVAGKRHRRKMTAEGRARIAAAAKARWAKFRAQKT